MVAGRMTVGSDRESMSVQGGDLSCVKEFLIFDNCFWSD